MHDNIVLGIDVGASGIKGALVDIDAGVLVSDRHRIPTPKPATPKNVAVCVAKLVDHFNWKGIVGCGFPAVVRHGKIFTASNIDKDWIGTNAQQLFESKSGCQFIVCNDADAAGIGEIHFGNQEGKKGTVILITIGTGLGTAFFHNGHLFPNTEFGQFKIGDKVAEKYAADSVRKKESLEWDKWGKRFNKYLKQLEKLVWPDLFLLGGGASKKFDNYKDCFDIQTPVAPAKLLNHAGIIGAAFHAHQEMLVNSEKG